jgi:hypothetical protein
VEPPFPDRTVVHSGNAQIVANMVDPSADSSGVRPGIRRLLE